MINQYQQSFSDYPIDKKTGNNLIAFCRNKAENFNPPHQRRRLLTIDPTKFVRDILL